MLMAPSDAPFVVVGPRLKGHTSERAGFVGRTERRALYRIDAADIAGDTLIARRR